MIDVWIYFLVARGPDLQPNIKLALPAQVQMLNQFTRPLGFNLRTKKVRTIPDPDKKNGTIQGAAQKYAALRLYGLRRGYIRRGKWITSFVVSGPLDAPSGKRWNYGFANRVCALIRYPMTLTTNVAWNVLYNIVALWHELCHILGAYHDESLPASLMHPNALAFVKDEPLTLSSKSERQILGCRVETYTR